MWSGERPDDLGEGSEMEVHQGADGMMVIEEIVVNRQGAETVGTVDRAGPRAEQPARRLVAPDGRARGPEPAVARQGPSDRGRGPVVGLELGVKRQDACSWDLAALQGLWYLQGRRAAPGRPAEPPGRPEHATRALALLRRAAERGHLQLGNPVAFFGPVLGHLPDYQRLVMDMPFPHDPFLPLPEPPDDRPLPPAAGAAPK